MKQTTERTFIKKLNKTVVIRREKDTEYNVPVYEHNVVIGYISNRYKYNIQEQQQRNAARNLQRSFHTVCNTANNTVINQHENYDCNCNKGFIKLLESSVRTSIPWEG